MSGWYYATSPRATFGFEFARGRVVSVAPYGRKWLLGRKVEDAVEELRRRGYVVKRGDRCTATEAQARCLDAEGHEPPHVWEDLRLEGSEIE